MHTKLELTAIIEKSEDGWYVGQVEELPGAISQGKTIDELMENLTDAVDVLLKAQREYTRTEYQGRKIIKRKLHYSGEKK